MTLSEPHRLLRQQTEALHTQSETAFAAFDLRTRHGYAAFLTAQAEAVLPLEAWLDREDIRTLLPDWPARRRTALLRADLAQLGIEAAAPSSAIEVTGAPLGVAYVLEGSRHGARILVRLPRASPDPDVSAATRFLGHMGEPGAWQGLIALLDREGSTPVRHADIVAGAACAFGVFHRAAVQVARETVSGTGTRA